MVGPTELESVTSCVSSRRSNQLSYGPGGRLPAQFNMRPALHLIMSVIHPPRRLLFGPGPSQVEPRVYRAMAQPIVGHLDPFFFEVVEAIREDLRVLFGTQNSFVHALSGTGSAGMEAAVSNFLEPGQKLVVFTAGFFGDRIVEMGRRHGANVFVCKKPWGETFSE